MSRQSSTTQAATPAPASLLEAGRILQRKCACGKNTGGGGDCGKCAEKGKRLQRRASSEDSYDASATESVGNVLRSQGSPLDNATRSFMESRFGHDFSRVKVHTDARAVESARAVNALAYTVGRDIAFGAGQYAPATGEGRRLIAHELAHVVQQSSSGGAGGALSAMSDGTTTGDSAGEREADAAADAVLAGRTVARVSASPATSLQRKGGPFIKKVTVHLTPDETADLEWDGTPPTDAPGLDHFPVSTGKGYSDPTDDPGTCTRSCCTDAATQCAPPWNKPGKTGSCCTYVGNNFWTGTPLAEHNGWKWWTPIQPYYSTRGIALHQHPDVTGKPIGHGCVRMDEDNAKRIHDFSRGTRTNVTIDGTASPVKCEADRLCTPPATPSQGTGGVNAPPGGSGGDGGASAMNTQEPIPGLEGVMS